MVARAEQRGMMYCVQVRWRKSETLKRVGGALRGFKRSKSGWATTALRRGKRGQQRVFDMTGIRAPIYSSRLPVCLASSMIASFGGLTRLRDAWSAAAAQSRLWVRQ